MVAGLEGVAQRHRWKHHRHGDRLAVAPIVVEDEPVPGDIVVGRGPAADWRPQTDDALQALDDLLLRIGKWEDEVRQLVDDGEKERKEIHEKMTEIQ